jgi:hypothetical protein
VRANAACKCLNAISTVTDRGPIRWKVSAGTPKTKILIRFLRRLTPGQKRKIFLILDSLREHHSKPVREWVAAQTETSKSCVCPVTRRSCPRRVTQCRPQALGHTCRLSAARTDLDQNRHRRSAHNQKQNQRVGSHFQKKDVCYAAA